MSMVWEEVRGGSVAGVTSSAGGGGTNSAQVQGAETRAWPRDDGRAAITVCRECGDGGRGPAASGEMRPAAGSVNE